MGKSKSGERPVIVRFCQRKKINEIMKKKAKLKNKQNFFFINDDLTPMRAAVLKIVKEQQEVKNATTRNGKVAVWRVDRPDRAIEIDDLRKIGKVSSDWERLKIAHLIKNKME